MAPQLGDIALKKRTVLFGFAIALLVLSSGIAVAHSQDFTPGSPSQDGSGGWPWGKLPDGASTYSKDVDILYIGIFWVVTGMFILTEGLLIIFCVLYRRRPGHRPSYTHGSRVAEITWTIVPALMLLTIAIVQIGTWNHIKKEMPAPGPGVTEVRALAQQYQWNIQYPKTKEKVQGDNDASTVGVMHIPFGDKALVHLRSADVIHSMFIPQMRVKQDLVPGLRSE